MALSTTWLRKATGRIARRLPFAASAVEAHRRRVRLRLLSMLPPRSRGAEIGVWRGTFSQQILDTVQPVALHLIDPWAFVPDAPDLWPGGRFAADQSAMDAVYRSVVERFAAHPEIVIHRKRSVDAAADFAPDSLDWVYIDGDHRYEAVRADLQRYLPIVRHGGFLAGDDYLWGLQRGLPVKRAVSELVAAGHVELVRIVDSQFLLRRP